MFYCVYFEVVYFIVCDVVNCGVLVDVMFFYDVKFGFWIVEDFIFWVDERECDG